VSAKSPLKADVVIIGGGFCGVTVAKLLSKQSELSVLLIDTREFFEYTPGLPRAITDLKVLSQLQLAYSEWISHIRLLKATVLSVSFKGVMTSEGLVRGRCYVLCAGASYPVPLAGRNVFVLRKGYDSALLHAQVKKAASIAILGGGLTGVEVAGELLTKTKAKVTLIEPGSRVLGRCPEKASVVAQKFMAAKGGVLRLKERVNQRNGKALLFASGDSVPADVVIWCGGLGWNMEWLRVNCKRSDRGALIVNKHLQLENYPHFFCGGDLSAVDEEKSAQNAERQGKLIAQNVIRFFQHKSLLRYFPAKRPMLISLGDWNGLFVYDKWVISGILPACLKRVFEKWFLLSLKWL